MIGFLSRRERLLGGVAVLAGLLAAVAAALGQSRVALVGLSLLAAGIVLMQLESRAKHRQALEQLRALPQQERTRRRQSQAALDKAVAASLQRIDEVGDRLVAAAGNERLAGADRHAEVVDALAQQAEFVGRQTESLTRRHTESIGRMTESVDRQRESIGRMTESVDRQRESIGRLSQQVPTEKSLLAGVEENVRRHEAHVDARLRTLRTDTVNQLSSVLQLLPRVPHTAPLPPLGGWAAEASTLLGLLHCVETSQPRLVLECGSGSSTVWLALAVQRFGGRVVALEHEEQYAERTRTLLAEHGLADVAEVRLAPLSDVRLGSDDFRWYDPRALADLSGIGLLFVDGPPKAVGEEARYPALPLLADRLAPGAWVVLDDVDRGDEAAVMRSWLDQHPALQWHRELDGRAALLRYRATALS